MTEYDMKQISPTDPNSKFYRIQPELYGADSALDNASADNLTALDEAGLLNAKKQDAILDKIVNDLIPVKPRKRTKQTE